MLIAITNWARHRRHDQVNAADTETFRGLQYIDQGETTTLVSTDSCDTGPPSGMLVLHNDSLRQAIEAWASSAVRHGELDEQATRKAIKNNPDLAFLDKSNPNNAYFESRKAEFRARAYPWQGRGMDQF